jgi:hypothetical protein
VKLLLQLQDLVTSALGLSRKQLINQFFLVVAGLAGVENGTLGLLDL